MHPATPTPTLNRSNDGQLPHLMILLNEFREANAVGTERTAKIKEKLLSVLTWYEEAPVAQEKNVLRESHGAAIDDLYLQLSSLQYINECLRNIYLHLSQIA